MGLLTILRARWACAALSVVSVAVNGSPGSAAPPPGSPPAAPAPRIVDCTDAKPMAELKKFVGTVLTFPDVAIPGVTLTIVGLTVLSDPTNAADPCTQPDRFASYRFRLHAVVRNVSASKVIVFNANVRCGLFGQDPVYDSGPNAKLGTLSFNLAFEDIHEGEYGLSLPFTGSPFDLNGVTFPEAGASFFVPHAIIDRCRVLINV